MLTGTGNAAVDSGSHNSAVANSLETGTPLRGFLQFTYFPTGTPPTNTFK